MGDLQQLMNKQQTMTKEAFQKELIQQSITDHKTAKQMQNGQGQQLSGQVHDSTHAMAFLNDCMERMSPATATATAVGTPVEAEVAREKGYKERRHDNKRLSAANKITGREMTLVECDTYDAMVELEKKKDASYSAIMADPAIALRVSATNPNIPMLKAFLKGYRTKKKGAPADENEAAILAEDRQFVMDYVSGDVNKRAPYLDKMTQELLKTHIDPAMFTPEYISKHYEEVKNLCDRQYYFEQLIAENPEFFDNLEPVVMELIQIRIRDMGAITGQLLNMTTQSMAINITNGTYYDRHNAQLVNTAVTGLAAKNTELADALRLEKAKEAEVFRKYYGAALDKSMEKARGKTDGVDMSKQAGGEAEFARIKAVFGDGKTDGALKASNDAYKAEKERAGSTPISIANAAKDAFHLRSKMSDEYKALGELRGETHDACTQALFDYTNTLFTDGIPVEMMVRDRNIRSASAATAIMTSWGCGWEQVTADLYKIIERNFSDPSKIEYFRKAYETFGKADIYGGSVEAFVNDFMSVELNRIGIDANAKFATVAQDAWSDTQKFSKSLMDNLKSLPRFLESGDDPHVAQLLQDAPEIKAIFDQYKILVSTIASKIVPKDQTNPDGNVG